jgi:hypothetical protein
MGELTMKKTTSSFLAGLIIGTFVFGSSIAYAWTGSISVDFLPLNYFFNGAQKYPASDQQGFIYNGKTYVPLRFMAEASGLSVDWDGNTNSIYVGSKPQTNQYMSDILQPYFNTANKFEANLATQMSGHKYYKGYFIDPDDVDDSNVSFNINKNYSEINGLIGLSDMANKGSRVVEIYGDGNLLTRYELSPGSLPQNLYLSVNGVTQLNFKFIKPSNYKDYVASIVLADLVIK